MITVYTAITECYDDLVPVSAEESEGVDYVAFTDSAKSEHGWRCRTSCSTERDGPRENRKYKTLSHRWFPTSDWTIYLDGNIQLLISPNELIELCLSTNRNASLYLFPHNQRNCLYAEAKFCIHHRRDNPTTIGRQVARYKAENYPAGNGLYWGGLLIRRKGCEKFNSLWWTEICTGSCRDQISLPYVLWKTGVNFAVLNYPIPFHGGVNPFIEKRPHSRRSSRAL